MISMDEESMRARQLVSGHYQSTCHSKKLWRFDRMFWMSCDESSSSILLTRCLLSQTVVYSGDRYIFLRANAIWGYEQLLYWQFDTLYWEALTRYRPNELGSCGIVTLLVSKPIVLYNTIYSLIGFPMVTMIILHSLRTNSIAFIVPRIPRCLCIIKLS